MTELHARVPVLSKRLRRIADLLGHCERLIDIGCDYAYLPAVMLAQDRAQRAVLTDIHPKPLQRAQTLMQALKLTGRCELYCCDGFGPVEVEKGDKIVIAGMGGREICSILQQRALPDTVSLVLQPNWNRECLRAYLASGAYRIEEFALRDKKVWYSIWLAEKSAKARELSLLERSIGEFWLSERRFAAENAQGWLEAMLRLYRDKSRKYPEYGEVCVRLEELCRSVADDL